MADFRSNKAPGRDANQTDTTDFEQPKGPASNQEQFTKQNFRTVKPNLGAHELGSLVEFAQNTKGTGVVGNPLNAYKRMVMAPVQNPDQGRDRSTSRKAPKS